MPQVPEIWDRGDPGATQHMELQVKKAIFCELRDAAIFTRTHVHIENDADGRDVTTSEDQALPSTWGAQIELTFTIDEKSTLSPTLSLKTPVHNAPVNFPGETIGATGARAAVTYGPLSVAQSFAFNLGGVLSSQAVRQEKYDYYYSMEHLIDRATNNDVCHDVPKAILGPDSHSSPFNVTSNLGIRDWLPGAVVMNSFERSSRAAPNGEGKPLSKDEKSSSDVMTYDIKFVIVSSGNLNPNWNLVRIGTGAMPALFDANRTRTHELLITIGPGAGSNKLPAGVRGANALLTRASGPSSEAAAAFLSSQIGNAVANALRQQQ